LIAAEIKGVGGGGLARVGGLKRVVNPRPRVTGLL